MTNSESGNITALPDSNTKWRCTEIFVRISLTANILILIAVCTVLLAYGNSEPVIYSWGPSTAARGILLSIYFAILVDSITLLALHLYF